MAISSKPKASTTTEQPPMAVASMNPDNMVQAGLADDFDGLCTKARFVPWDYEGKLDHHILGVAVTIKPDDSDEFTQTYSAGDLEHFVPSMDGRNGVDLENGEGEALEGIYALRIGSKTGLANSTNWAQFITAALDANFPKDKLGAACTFIEGVYGHWNRIPQRKRSGIVSQGTEGGGGSTRPKEILVLTELKEMREVGKSAASTKPTAAPKTGGQAPSPSTTAAAGASASPIDDKLKEVVTEAVKSAGDDGLPKNKLAALAMKAFTGADKGKAVKRVTELEFLENSETWAFDPDTATLIYTGE